MRFVRPGHGLLIAALLLGAARAADAQVLANATAGPAGYSGFFNSAAGLGLAAGGVEVLARGRGGVSTEAGMLFGSGGVLGLFSLNGLFRFAPVTGSAKVSPFVTGGYTRFQGGDGGFDAWNAGGGADVWVNEHVGIRAELRDHFRPDSRGTVHYWAVRGGVVVR